jgi:hypothetical protein
VTLIANYVDNSKADGEADRVHGLSGSNFNTSEDDMLFEEGQESQSNKQLVDLPKCYNSDMHKKDDRGYDIPDASPMEKVPPKECEISIADLLSIGKMVNAKGSGQPKLDSQPIDTDPRSDDGLILKLCSIQKFNKSLRPYLVPGFRSKS